MKNTVYLLGLTTLFLFSCENIKVETSVNTNTKNEVVVLGTIHGGHLTEEVFSLDVLRQLIKDINPDIILTEIPPDRFQVAMDGFIKDDYISEPRVMRFPEYVDVIFPLTKEMDFEIIPTAGWTKSMATERAAKMKAIRQDPDRKADWDAYIAAGKKSDSLMKSVGRGSDPYWINSDLYDEYYDVSLSVYNKLFNVELGLGGWDNINKAHYWYIAEALDRHKFEGKRVLITYGAGHKGWFLRELKKRDDIKLLSLKEAVEK